MKHTMMLIMVMAAFTLSAVAQCSEADKKALEAFDKAWGAAGLAGNRAALMEVYADDYVGYPSGENKTRAIENTMATFERNRANPEMADNVTWDHYMVSCTPSSATITHRNVITSRAGGKEETFYSRSVHFLEKRGGKWQVVSNAGHTLDDAATIWYLDREWADANLERDRAWFERNFARDFSAVWSDQLLNKAEAISDTVNLKDTLEFAETSDVSIRVEGNTAIVTGIFRQKGKDEKGVALDRRFRFTDMWIKRDGRWQAWASHATLLPN